MTITTILHLLGWAQATRQFWLKQRLLDALQTRDPLSYEVLERVVAFRCENQTGSLRDRASLH